MSTHSKFLNPKLTGKRFDDHSIPIELLEDFAAFEELIIELAKVIYLEKNTSRQRVPRGFSESVSLKLSGIDKGSAIPVIDLSYASGNTQSSSPTLELFPDANYAYFEEARDRIFSGIEAANENGSVTKYIPENLLGYFNRIGKRLKDDETIFFNPGINDKARLNIITRKKIVLASSTINVITAETTIIALIPEADKEKRTFTMQVEGGNRIVANIPEAHYDTVIKAFTEYEKNCKVSIKGIGRFNKQLLDKLESFESIEQFSIIDPLDVYYRLTEISGLSDGWLDGEGIAPNEQGLKWFASEFEKNFDTTLPLPFIYPTPLGNLQIEWNIGNHDISVMIDLLTKTADYHDLNRSNDDDNSLQLNFNTSNGWITLNELLIKLITTNEK
jgi:hypothetical protein